MATVTWRGGSSGDWSTPTNWTGFAVPQAGDDVVIGAGISVLIDTPGVAVDDVSLGAGAALSITSTLDVTGVLAGGTVALFGELTGGGTLESPLAGLGGTIDGVDVVYGEGIGGVTITPATAAATSEPIQVAGTVTLASGSYDSAFAVGTYPTTYDGENWYSLAVAGSVTLGPQANVMIGYVDGTSYNGQALVGAAGSTLTNQGTISGGNPYTVTISPASFINSGTVAITVVDYYGGPAQSSLEIDSNYFSNTGVVSDFGGSVTLDGTTVDNAGDITLTGGYLPDDDGSYPAGQLFVADTVSSFLNTGTIVAGGIAFAGFVTLPELGTLQGAVTIYGELDLEGATLDAGAYGGGITVTGTIRDGTLTANGGTLTLKSATLYDTTVAASANVVATGPITLIDPPDGSSVTLDGTTTELSFTSGNVANSLTITAGNAMSVDTIDVQSGSATLGAGSAITQVAGVVQIFGTLEDDGGIAVEAGTLELSTLLTGDDFIALAPDATMIVSGTLGGDGTVSLTDGAAVTIDALGAAATPTIDFSGSAELAVLPGNAAGVTLGGLQAGDLIDFAGLSSAGGGVALAEIVGGMLEVIAASGQTATTAATDAAPGLQFSVIADGSGGSLVQAIPAPPALSADTSFDNVPGTDYGTYVLDGGTVMAGAVTVEGSYAVDLLAGALWQTGAIAFGPGIASDTAGDGLLTLSGGVADGGTLNANGVLTLGEDPGTTPTNAASVGGLTAEDGVTVFASGLTLENGASVAVDATSSVVLGQAAATAGALTVAAGATLYATVGTIGGNVIDAGTIILDITPDAGNGTLTVDGGFTLSSSFAVDALTALEIAGTATLLNGATFGAEDSTATSATLAVEGTAWVTMLMQQGAVWQTNALDIGGNAVPDTPPAQGSLEVQGGGGIAVAGAIVLGADAGPDSGGGVGELGLSESTITAASVSLLNGSSVSNYAGALVLGNATETSNAIAIGQDGTLSVDVGTLDGFVIDDGSLLLNADGGTPASLAIDDGAYGGGLTIESSLNVTNATLDVADPVVVSPGGTLVVGDGGTLIAGALAGSMTLDGGSATIAAISGATTIDDGSGSLQIGGSDLAGLLVDNITQDIDLPDIAFSTSFGGGVRSLGIAGGTFDIANIAYSPSQQPELFTTPDGNGGTLIEQYVPCYAAGTRVLAEHGEVPVETLRAGERVRTLSGRLAPVIWVGATRVALARHPQPHRAAPIRVAANAIAPGVPRRDVLLSRDHALFIDGALIPVWQLANGATIARQDGLASITYVHVELDRHDIMLAEAMPAESYLDTGNRGLFANAAGVRPLHADFAETPDAAALRIWARQAAAPLLLGGDAVAVVRDRLLRRALSLGWAQGHHPALCVSAGGKPLAAQRSHTGWRVRVPAAATTLRLRSRSFVPAERSGDSGDMRRLGLAVAALRLGGVLLPADCLGAGWHAPDQPGTAWRWTDGAASVRVPPRVRAATLEIELAFNEQYWLRPAGLADKVKVPSHSR